MSRIEGNGLQVASALVAFIEEQALPGTGVSADAFWSGLSGLIEGMGAIAVFVAGPTLIMRANPAM